MLRTGLGGQGTSAHSLLIDRHHLSRLWRLATVCRRLGGSEIRSVRRLRSPERGQDRVLRAQNGSHETPTLPFSE